MKPIIIIVAGLLCTSADIAPNPLTTGGTSLTPKDGVTSVEMTWEEVDLTPSLQSNHVKAVFGLRNIGKESAELEVGFPSYYQMPLEDFTLEIDGEKQTAEVKKVGSKGPKQIFTYWMCWPMKFAAGAERKVVVTYRVKTQRVYEALHIKDLPAELKPKLWGYQSGYVLRTGAGWVGKIGKAVIRVHYGPEVKRSGVVKLAPRGWAYDESTNIDTLTLAEFEPDDTFDIAYEFRPVTVAEELPLLEAALRQKTLDPWAQGRLLSLIEGKESPLTLTAEEKEKRILETLEWMVLPQGPAVDQAKISRGAEAVVHKAYGRLMGMYGSLGQKEKARALAGPYRDFLKVMLDRDVASKGKNGYAGREYARLEDEYKKLQAIE